jgi:ATP-dependent helicase YprA (DUF1998 family)
MTQSECMTQSVKLFLDGSNVTTAQNPTSAFKSQELNIQFDNSSACHFSLIIIVRSSEFYNYFLKSGNKTPTLESLVHGSLSMSQSRNFIQRRMIQPSRIIMGTFRLPTTPFTTRENGCPPQNSGAEHLVNVPNLYVPSKPQSSTLRFQTCKNSTSHLIELVVVKICTVGLGRKIQSFHPSLKS